MYVSVYEQSTKRIIDLPNSLRWFRLEHLKSPIFIGKRMDPPIKMGLFAAVL